MKKLSQKKFDDYIGCMVNPNSKKRKTISQSKKLPTMMMEIIDYFLKHTEGKGQYPICQNLWRDQIVGGIKMFPRDVTESIKLLEDLELLVRITHHYEKGEHSYEYVAGKALKELIKMDLTFDDDTKRLFNECKKDTRIKYEGFGFRINDKQVCQKCGRTLFITKFGIDQMGFIQHTCKDCYYDFRKRLPKTA